MALSDNFRKVVPYVPGEQPQKKNIIKLNTNENPYPPSPNVIKAIEDFDGETLRLYPEPNIDKLRRELAEYLSNRYIELDKDNVFVGVGSDDVLSTAFLTFFNSGRCVEFADITYSFYDVWCDVYKIPYKQIPVKSDFTINPEDYKSGNGGVVIANPNAPTGIELPLTDIGKILKENSDVVVIVDEAYVDFGGNSAISLINDYKNLVVVQTFSKSRSMAGARIGFAVANKELIKAMSDVKFSINSYTLTNMFIEAGVASVKDNDYFETQVERIINTREKAKEELTNLGFSITDSKTNFLWATHKSLSARVIFEKLREKDIFVRYFNKPGIDNYLRITVGTDEEMNCLYDALRDIVG